MTSSLLSRRSVSSVAHFPLVNDSTNSNSVTGVQRKSGDKQKPIVNARLKVIISQEIIIKIITAIKVLTKKSQSVCNDPMIDRELK